MKKLLAVLVVCVLTVTVYLLDGTKVQGDNVVRYLNNGIIIEHCVPDGAVEKCTRTFIPNYIIQKVIEDDV